MICVISIAHLLSPRVSPETAAAGDEPPLGDEGERRAHVSILTVCSVFTVADK